MTFQDTYNSIIQEIEALVASNCQSIPETIAKQYGLDLRLIGDAFRFISGMPMGTYIRQRKLVHALSYKFSTDRSLEDIADQYGYSDAAAMSKAIKSCLGYSPSQLTPEKVRQFRPLTLDIILAGGHGTVNSVAEADAPKKNLFGVTKDQFSAIKNALELNSVYGFSDNYVELAYSLSQRHKKPLAIAFEFVEDLVLQFENGTSLGTAQLNEIAYLSFGYDLSVSESIFEINSLHAQDVLDITELPDGFFDIYFSESNKDFDFLAEDICDFVELMKKGNVPFKCFDEVMEQADLFDGCINDAIDNFHGVPLWDKLLNSEKEYRDSQEFF